MGIIDYIHAVGKTGTQPILFSLFALYNAYMYSIINIFNQMQNPLLHQKYLKNILAVKP